MKTSSYWLDTIPAISTTNTYANEGQVDTVVIGGGFTGLSTAFALAKRGAKVVLCEANIVGGEASGRNGGQCNNGTAQDYAGLISTYGEDKAASFYQFYNDAVNSVENLVKNEKIDCDFRRAGKIKLAAKPEHMEKLAKTHEALIKLVDPKAQLLDQNALKSEINGGDFYGGLLTPDGAQLHVGKLVNGLANLCMAYGVTILQHSPVTDLSRTASGQCNRR